MTAVQPDAPLYRIDKFTVPTAARPEFLRLVEETHAVLRHQPGFVRDLLLDQVIGDGDFNVVTFVEWSDRASFDGAVAAMQEFRRASGFDPRSTLAHLGIAADFGTYQEMG